MWESILRQKKNVSNCRGYIYIYIYSYIVVSLYSYNFYDINGSRICVKDSEIYYLILLIF